MYFDENFIIKLITYAVLIAVAIYLFKRGRSVWGQTKEILFSPHALLATILHVFLFVGLFGVWTACQVYIFDHDVQIRGKATASKK